VKKQSRRDNHKDQVERKRKRERERERTWQEVDCAL
jgi:hypothetical protein